MDSNLTGEISPEIIVEIKISPFESDLFKEMQQKVLENKKKNCQDMVRVSSKVETTNVELVIEAVKDISEHHICSSQDIRSWVLKKSNKMLAIMIFYWD